MNHIPRYPVKPVTKSLVIPSNKIVTAGVITEDSNLLFSISADSEGMLLSNIIINGNGNSVATVLRFILNNGLDYNNLNNNVLFHEVGLTAITANTTTVSYYNQIEFNTLFPPSYRLYANLATANTTPISVICNLLEY